MLTTLGAVAPDGSTLDNCEVLRAPLRWKRQRWGVGGVVVDSFGCSCPKCKAAVGAKLAERPPLSTAGGDEPSAAQRQAMLTKLAQDKSNPETAKLAGELSGELCGLCAPALCSCVGDEHGRLLPRSVENLDRLSVHVSVGSAGRSGISSCAGSHDTHTPPRRA